MSETRLVGMRVIRGTLRVETGLRIGANSESVEISGLDNPILRAPGSEEPYIPGSSLKGRLRSLAEWYYGELPGSPKEPGNPAHPVATSRTARVFGIPASDTLAIGPTRLLVRDAPMSAASRQRLAAGEPITEVKSENAINRLTAMANPRPMERVLPGVEFDVELVYRIFDVDGDGGATDRANFAVVEHALALLELDALGGGSSRGNGKVSLHLKVDGEALHLAPPTFA